MSSHPRGADGSYRDPSLGELLAHHFTRDNTENAPASRVAAAEPDVADPDLEEFRAPNGPPAPFLQDAVEESAAFEHCLECLLHGDELDRNQALVDLTGRYRSLLIARLLRTRARRSAEMEPILEVLWRHLDVILISDRLWTRRDRKVALCLSQADAYPVGVQIRKLLSLFRLDPARQVSPHTAVSELGLRNDDERRTVLRTLLAHPLEPYRHYAAARLETPHCWSPLSLPRVPVTVLPEILNRLSCSDAERDHRKVFLDCTLRSIAAPRSEPQVRAARKILNRFAKLDFSYEDQYFKKLVRLHQVVEREGRLLACEDERSRSRFDAFRREKERRGPRKTRLPKGLSRIPLPVQRKLAREGHYLKVFIRHPHPKIALETASFITTPKMAEAVLRARSTNRRLVGELSTKRELFRSYRARLALLSNPHTTLAVGLEYLANTREDDLRRLRSSRDINPEIRAYLRSKLATSRR